MSLIFWITSLLLAWVNPNKSQTEVFLLSLIFFYLSTLLKVKMTAFLILYLKLPSQLLSNLDNKEQLSIFQFNFLYKTH